MLTSHSECASSPVRPIVPTNVIGIASRMRRESRSGTAGTANATGHDQLIEQLISACQQPTMQRALLVGQLVIDNLYGGELELWREKRAKWRPYRLLSKREDLPLSAADMYRCTAIYVLSARSGSAERWPELTISHLRQVVGLEDDVQSELLDCAQARRWSVTQLALAVKDVRLTAPEQRGRPALHPMQKALQRMARVVEEAHDQEGRPLLGLDRDDLQELMLLTQRVSAFCQNVTAQLEGDAG